MSKKTIIITTIIILTIISLLLLRFTSSKSILIQQLLGIIGVLLVLQNELFYTWRKKGFIKFGSLGNWKQYHIIIGIIGLCLIIWHTDLNFYGFSGFVTLLMIVVVFSGFFGHFIYRYIPGSLKGKKQSLIGLTAEKQKLENELRKILTNEPKLLEEVFRLEIITPKGSGIKPLISAAKDFQDKRFKINRSFASLGKHYIGIYKQLEKTAVKRMVFEKYIAVLSRMERTFSNWRKIHQPLTLTLFFAIGVHVVTIIYYGRII